MVFEQLHLLGVRHVELAWSPHPGWMSLMKEVQKCFAGLCLGAASISCPEALQSVAELGLAYAMTSSLAWRSSSEGAGYV